MSVWHVPPDHIVNNFSDEMLMLMLEKHVERKEAEAEAMKKAEEEAKKEARRGGSTGGGEALFSVGGG